LTDIHQAFVKAKDTVEIKASRIVFVMIRGK
jgi:hypothetical protein